MHERKKGLTVFDDNTSVNYKALFDAINTQQWGFVDGKPKLINGYAGYVLEGSSRSTKTFAGCFIILYLALIKHTKGCTINIYRETYNEFKTTLYDDFKRILDMFGLDNPFHKAKEVSSFKIGKTKVHFLGDGKHGGGCDYAFFNEAMMIKPEVFDQVEMRCRKFWWMDYNPSFTDHWVFDRVVPREDVGFLRTTFKDNNFISATELNKILSYEPWESGSYEVTIEGDLLYLGDPITEKHQPPPHIENSKSGTADEFMWKVYGLGLRGAMKGVIYPYVTWIDEFPDIAHTWGMDFGFTADPTTLIKYARERKNIYLELFIYQPIDNAEDLDAILRKLGVSQYIPITADSSDRYVSEKKGVVKMVTDLYDLGWEISKVSKTKGKVYWILDFKGYKIHIVKKYMLNPKTGKNENIMKKEQENYIWKTINGIQINQPIDGYDHGWDATLYAHMAHDNYSTGAEWN